MRMLYSRSGSKYGFSAYVGQSKKDVSCLTMVVAKPVLVLFHDPGKHRKPLCRVHDAPDACRDVVRHSLFWHSFLHFLGRL